MDETVMEQVLNFLTQAGHFFGAGRFFRYWLGTSLAQVGFFLQVLRRESASQNVQWRRSAARNRTCARNSPICAIREQTCAAGLSKPGPSPHRPAPPGFPSCARGTARRKALRHHLCVKVRANGLFMRIKLILALLLIPTGLFAQERVTVRGRIVNERGEAVEYVQVGIPKLQEGTISSADGLFEITVPADTLHFFHVSYQPAIYPVTGPADDVVVVLQEQELQPAVFTGGNTKEKYLIRRGMNLGGKNAAIDFYRPDTDSKGMEFGSIADTRKPFLIRDILFSITCNHIPGCVVAINIYRIEGKPETFTNILHKPIYVSIPQSDTEQGFDVQPEESILLDPGRYFIAFQIVATDEEAVRKYQETPESERDPMAMHMLTRVYLKSSYHRTAAMTELEHLPVNIGISVKGLEYQ